MAETQSPPDKTTGMMYIPFDTRLIEFDRAFWDYVTQTNHEIERDWIVKNGGVSARQLIEIASTPHEGPVRYDHIASVTWAHLRAAAMELLLLIAKAGHLTFDDMQRYRRLLTAEKRKVR